MRAIYDCQTKEAIAANKSNCTLCADEHGENAQRIYRLDEMDIDYVTPLNKGGTTDASNCQMLCAMHNRVKGCR